MKNTTVNSRVSNGIRAEVIIPRLSQEIRRQTVALQQLLTHLIITLHKTCMTSFRPIILATTTPKTGMERDIQLTRNQRKTPEEKTRNLRKTPEEKTINDHQETILIISLPTQKLQLIIIIHHKVVNKRTHLPI